MDDMVPLAASGAASFAAAPGAQASPTAATAARRAPRRLAIRLAWLTVITLLVAEAMFVVPSMVRHRAEWLDRRMNEAQLAGAAAALAPAGTVDPATRDELLRLASAAAIYLEQPGQPPIRLFPDAGLPPAAPLDLAQESPLEAVARTAMAIFAGGNDVFAVTSPSPLRPGVTITVALRERDLHAAMLAHARHAGIVSLVLAAVAGVLLYIALLYVLVRPMRRLTESIAAFRADPERSTPLDETDFARHRQDEIASAARELAAMQRELRAALWRNARLAALGTAVAKVNHDLRGILSPALLTAERLQTHADPGIRRAGDVLVRTVDRAAELMRRTLEFTRETPMALPRRRLALRAAVDDAAEQARANAPGLAIANLVPPDQFVEADRESLVRVFGNLLRNAGEAEARRVSITTLIEGAELAIVVADDGPGLPERVQAELFRPFVVGGRRGSTGLGLAIVHDLMRAHGGDVVLLDTGPGGTRFRLTLPDRGLAAAAAQAAGSAT
jgi:signal transduction histidine kinase